MIEVSRRRRGLLVAAVVVVLAVGGFVWEVADGGSHGGRERVDTSVFVAHPGSEMLSDHFSEADSGRYIDGDRFSEPARLVRRYRLATPVSRSEFATWRDDVLPPPGWDGPHRFDHNRVSYTGTVLGERHVLALSIISGGEPGSRVSEYELTYTLPR